MVIRESSVGYTATHSIYSFKTHSNPLNVKESQSERKKKEIIELELQFKKHFVIARFK